tara:strand:+ start:1362 stop:1568 length:207 start_codon:yes stop_codon:yes gene_type:complete
MESDLFILAKTLVVGGALVYCGYLLGKDKGIKVGANKTVDTLCDSGYLRHKKMPDGNTELIKLNGEIE